MTLRRLLRPARMHPGLLSGCTAGFLCAWFVPAGAPALVRGVFAWEGRTVGLLDEGRLFEALRTRLR